MKDALQRAFGQVRADEALKASAARYLAEEREGYRPRRSRLRPALAAACAALLLCVGLGGYQLLFVPVSYVSIDVNPSVELSLNRLDRVVSATAYNEEGEALLAGLALSGRTYTQAIDALLESEAAEGYLEGPSGLTFTVASGSEEKDAALLRGIEDWDGYGAYGAQSWSTDMDCLAQAHSHGLSFGKYAAFLTLSEYDDTLTAEDCHGMSMSEICSRIQKHESGEYHHYGGSHHGSSQTPIPPVSGNQEETQAPSVQPQSSETLPPSYGHHGYGHHGGHD